MKVIKRDGRKENVDVNKIIRRIKSQSKGLKNIEPMDIAKKVIDGLHDGVTTSELDSLAIKKAAALSTKHTDYDILASRLSASVLHKSTMSSFSKTMDVLYNIKDQKGRDKPFITKEFYEIVMKHKKVLDSEIIYSRDYNFNYLGFSTLLKSYLAKANGVIVERPQHMWMRVAIGIHGNDIPKAIETYHLLSQKIMTHATPTLFNAGTISNNLISCFLYQIEDDSLDSIYQGVSDCAAISKQAGGIGFHHHDIRSAGSPVYGTGGISNGIVPMLRVYDTTALYVDQGGGKRKGSFATYIAPHHADIISWLDLKKNNGKEEVRARNLFYGLWVPDLFMERVKNNDKWTLMDPAVCKGLEDVHSEEFEKLYVEYEDKDMGVKTIKARDLWAKIIETQLETSMPYMMYKDAVNYKSNQKNVGTIKSSNLCTEIVEYSSPEECASCNLCSVALPPFVKRGKFDHKGLHNVVKVATRNLNKVIDINNYPIKKAEVSNFRHRPIGIGVQGLADTFIKLQLTWESEDAFKLNKEIFETIYHASLEASMELAVEEGPYSTFKGSPASEGKLQFDLTFEHLKKTFNQVKGKTQFEWCDPNNAPLTAEDYFCSDRYDWKDLKKQIMKKGLRNSLLIALMPTASTASILGNTESIEPVPANIFKRSVLSGEFVVANKYLVAELCKLGIWNQEMKQRIIAAEGSIRHIESIPDKIKDIYKTVWEISPKALIEMSAARGAFVCQSQSFNLYMAEPSMKSLTSALFYGHSFGLKTGSYYIRQPSARQAQKFSVDVRIEADTKSQLKDNTLVNDEGPYQQGRQILIDRGFTPDEVDAMSRSDVIQNAAEACSLDDPDECTMCSA